jgi:hypothetical protein
VTVRSLESVHSTYLRFGLEIGERKVAVSTPDGRRIGETYSLPEARCMVRGYRRALKAGQS